MDKKSEEAALGCMLIDEIAAREGVSRLMASDFTTIERQRIFDAIREVIDEGKSPDIITVTRKSRRDAIYITELSSMIVSTANFREYLQSVIEDASLQNIHMAGLGIQEVQDLSEIITTLTDQVSRIHNRLQNSDDYSASVTVTRTLSALDQRLAGQKPGLPTPAPTLTAYTGGWQPSDLIIIAARPSIGKTAFALACAVKALEAQVAVVFFSLEMSRERIMDRLLIGRAGVDALRYRTGKLTGEEMLRINSAAGYFADQRLWIRDSGNLGLGEVEAFCMEKKREGNCDLVIIDYLQLMKTRQQKNRTRDADLAELSRGLKLLAKELDVPVMVLSQLNREVEKRGNKRPILSDLRESGAIEQDADVVLMLYRAAYYNEQYINIGHQEISSLGIGEVNIVKHRNGETGTLYWTHNDSLTKIGGWPSTEFEYQSFAP